MPNLIVPVGEGRGVTKGEWSNFASGRGLGGLMTEEVAVMSSSREVKDTLICVEGNRIIHLKEKRLADDHTPVHVHAE